MAVVALDSFDLPRAGCTTHVASLLILYLHEEGFELTDFPRLVRLNPAVPWKTRGNASIAFEVNGSKDEVFEKAKEFLKGLNGALAVSDGWIESNVYPLAVERVVANDIVIETIIKNDVLYQGKKEALVGALAALSTKKYDVPNFELLAYRVPERFGTPRTCTFGEAYSILYDLLHPCVHESSPSVVCPKGDDPVLFGLRGRSTPCLVALAEAIESEPVSHYVVFRSNQHSYKPKLPARYVYDYGKLKISVKKDDLQEVGEDLKIKEYFLFKETGLSSWLKKLLRYDGLKGDLEIDVIMKPEASSIARIGIRRVVAFKKRAPRCPRCGGPMVSLGAKTLKRRCKRCGYVTDEVPMISIIEAHDLELFPVEGRKLHLEGPYRGPPEEMRKAFCERLEPGCAVTRGFGPHRP